MITPKLCIARLADDGDDPAVWGDTTRLRPEAAVGAAPSDQLCIRPWSAERAKAFYDINAQWIEAMFVMEDVDRDVLLNPQDRIIAPGGDILFVEAPGRGIIGTCALKKTAGSGYELTKMGVLGNTRGLKAGEFLLKAAIARGVELGGDPLYLLTNSACAAAIHLYEKLGFVHDADIMRDYGASYDRCNVAMRYAGS